MNKLSEVLDRIVSGVTVVTTSVSGNPFGMTASWVARASNQPFMISVSISQKSFTHDKLKESNFLGLNLMSCESKKDTLIFGKKSGRYINKFEGVEFKYSTHGNPIFSKGIVAFLDCEIVHSLKAGDHTLFLAEVLDGILGENEDPLVYYRKNFSKIQGSSL